jgi:RsiW-degrading membrane proteinase PrsW (M82 family)
VAQQKQPDAAGSKAGYAAVPGRQAYSYPYSYPAPYAFSAYYGYPTYQPYRPYPVYPYPYPSYAYASYYAPVPFYAPPPPPRAPGETYRLVLAWITTVGGGLSLVGGLLWGLLTVITALVEAPNNLAVLATDGGLALAAVLGGVAGLVYGILAILRRPSPRFGFPQAWIFLGLTVLAIGGGVVLWNVLPVPGSAVALLPLVILAGLLPVLTILAFTAGRLRFPTTWRHLVLSVAFGSVVAVLLALILETILQFAIVAILIALGYQFSPGFGANNFNPSNPGQVIAILLLLSVVAPIVEEGVKPLGAVLLMPRIRGPNEAFLLGLAAGLGFAVIETLGYFSMGEADWIGVAVARIGAGLLHGVGAGMGALGWYYLIRGKGVPLRWLRGFGALLYAVVQHAVFNGSNLITVVPPIGKALSQPFYLGQLPLDSFTWVAFVFYAIILGVLILVTGRLRRLSADALPPKTAPILPGAGAPVDRAPQPVPGGAR